MRNKQLYLLFLCNLVVLFVGMGLFPLLPLYAAQFGATPTIIGLYYAVMYVASVVGTIATGWLVQRIPPRPLFVSAGVLGIAALVLLGQVTALWQIVLLTAAVWFAGAITIPLVSLFTATIAGTRNRGKSFTLMYLAYPVGAVLGGTAVGQLVARHGYPVMFATLGLVWAALPVIGLLLFKGISVPTAASTSADPSGRSTTPLGRPFFSLLSALLLSAIAVNAGRLGTSLSMEALHFSPGPVASTATVSGLIAIPVVLLIGALADRLGYHRFLIVGYLLAAAGSVTLMLGSQLWHFWLAATLLMVAFCTNLSVASAYASEILQPEILGRGLPLLNTMDSVASTLSFAAVGYVMEMAGPSILYVMAATLAFGAALQLHYLQRLRTTSAGSGVARGADKQASDVVTDQLVVVNR